MATIVVGENSYVTEAELTTYADDRGETISGDTSVLLIKAMDYIEMQSYKGLLYVDGQDLVFPRTFYNWDTEDAGEVPPKVKEAQLVSALLIDQGADLTPSFGRAVKREKVDVIEREFMDNAQTVTTYPQITRLLAYYLDNAGGLWVDRA
jgi:hypothetical protein